MDNKNEKDFEGHSQPEGKSSKDAIPLWLQGLEDPNLEETSPIYPKNDMADNWVKEIVDDPSENGGIEHEDTFISLGDDETSDRVLPDWLSELSKVEPSLPKIMPEESVEPSDKPIHETDTHDEISLHAETTEEIEIEKIPPESVSEPEDESYDNGFVEISDINLQGTSEIEVQESNDNYIPEETLPYWLRDMIAEPNESAANIEEHPPVKGKDELEQDHTDVLDEIFEEPQTEEIVTLNTIESSEGQEVSISNEPFDAQEQGEVFQELPVTNEKTSEKGDDDSLVEAIELEDSPEETVEREEGSEGVGISSNEQEQDITQPIHINEKQPSEQTEIIMSEIETDNQPHPEEDLVPDDIEDQPEASTTVEPSAAQEQTEQSEESPLQDTQRLIDEKAELETKDGVQTQEETSPSAVGSDPVQSDENSESQEEHENEELEDKGNLTTMDEEGQQDSGSMMEMGTHPEESVSIEHELNEPDLAAAPEVYEESQSLPPEREVPVTLETQSDAAFPPPPAGPEMHEDHFDLEETTQIQPATMPKTLLFAKYLLEQGDVDSATQIFGNYIEKSEHLEDIEAWLIDAANDTGRSNSKILEIMGDIAMIQENPNRAFESYSQAIEMLLRTEKDYDETY